MKIINKYQVIKLLELISVGYSVRYSESVLKNINNQTHFHHIKKYLINRKGESYCKTCNIIKAEIKLLKLTKRLTNIRHNYLHQPTTEIINRKPKFIVLEDLNLTGMMKIKHLSKKLFRMSRIFSIRAIFQRKVV